MITFGQSPDTMKVIGQQNKSIDSERMPLRKTLGYIPQQRYIVRQAQNVLPVISHHGEEVCASFRSGSAISKPNLQVRGHVDSIV